MSLALFILVLIVSFIVVRIGAVAFQITGLEWSLAKFQALSCFTGTGFTTREAELITTSKQRRRIASVLMVLGNAGLVVMIATLARSLNPAGQIWSRLSGRLLPFEIPAFVVPWVNLGIIVVAVYVIYRLFANPKLSGRLTRYLRKRIVRKDIFARVSFEELLLTTGGYGVSKVAVLAGSPIANKTLADSQLRARDVTVLAIVRENHTTPNPPATTMITLGDELICFGKLETIRNQVSMNP
ncbi:MAG: hypothetical protein JSU70_15900 [Phycisphaerales bacterium]|nr:MAG: hypothetical protein JSU70_15900 [Phycisphaerales bacterium]